MHCICLSSPLLLELMHTDAAGFISNYVWNCVDSTQQALLSGQWNSYRADTHVLSLMTCILPNPTLKTLYQGNVQCCSTMLKHAEICKFIQGNDVFVCVCVLFVFFSLETCHYCIPVESECEEGSCRRG